MADNSIYEEVDYPVMGYDDIMNTPKVTNEPKPATDVLRFVRLLNATLKKSFTEAEEDDLKAYLANLHTRVVFDGKEFKNKIPNGSMEEVVEEISEGEEKRKGANINVPGAKAYYEIQCKNSVFCLVVRGSKDADGHVAESKILNLENKETKEKYQLPVVTYKLLQACVSVLVCVSGAQKDVNPARLGANAVRGCKLKDSKKSEQHWACHAHSGLNFVAKYVYQKMKEFMADEKNARKPLERLREQNLPEFHHFLMMAIRMDEANKKAALPNQKMNQDYRNPTLKAIFQTVQMTEAEAAAYEKKIDPKNWMSGVAGASQQMADAFYASIKKKDQTKPSPEVAAEGENQKSGRSGTFFNADI